jgi:hypothetical protein
MRGTQRQKKARKTRKFKRLSKNRGKGRGKEWKMTPITDKKELKRLEEAERIAAEREKNDNEIIRLNARLEEQKNNIISSWLGTPMDPEEIKKQKREDELHNKRVNSKHAKSRKLTIYDLGGSKRRKYHK